MQHPVSDLYSAPHLGEERLAALADEPPTAGEAAHLAACAACRREREAYVALVALARSEGPLGHGAAWDADPDASQTDARHTGEWNALAAALRAEGVARGGDADGTIRRRERAGLAAPRWAGLGVAAWTRRAPGQLAAGLLLAVGAAAAGRLSATRGPFAASPGGSDAAVAFASSDEALETLARARRDYARAAAFLAVVDSAGTAEDGVRGAGDAELLRARLATLDALIPRVRAAARQAPEDPAVNQLYLAAYDARETALRQLGRTLPAGVQLSDY